MNRNKIQQSAVETFKKSEGLVLQWGTSLGKSKVAIDIIKYLYSNNKNKILLIVAEIPHKKNWELEFDKWKVNHTNIIIECYASLKKYKNTNWDLIVFDEAHHLGSDLRLSIIENIKAEKLLLLSATLPDQLIIQIESIFNKKLEVSKISLKQAIDWNILPEPKLYLISLDLDNTIQNQVITEEWGTKNKRITYNCNYIDRWHYLKNKTKYPNITLNINCTQLQKYNYLTEKFEYWKLQYFRTRREHTKNKWLQIGSQRKRFLGESKTNIVKGVLSKLKNKRYICFCSSIEQAEILGGKNAIHSKKDSSLSIIDKFNNKKQKSIFAVGMLQEGQNLTDIEAGIIVQLDGQERAFIQKFGRSMRAEDPIQFIFYYKNTRDEEYLNSVLEDIDSSYIYKIDNLKEFKL